MGDSVRAVFRSLSHMLAGLNYVVSLGLYRTAAVPGATPEELILAALGPNTVVGGITPFTGQEVMVEVEQCLRYAGDEGHGPDRATLDFHARRFERLLGRLRRQIEHSLSEATTVVQFWLSEGHPFYPACWDFAFLFVRPQGAEVFIGAASD